MWLRKEFTIIIFPPDISIIKQTVYSDLQTLFSFRTSQSAAISWAPRIMHSPSLPRNGGRGAAMGSWPWRWDVVWRCSARTIPWGAWGCDAGCGPGKLEAVLETRSSIMLSVRLECVVALNLQIFFFFFVKLPVIKGSFHLCHHMFSQLHFHRLPLSRKFSLVQPKNTPQRQLGVPVGVPASWSSSYSPCRP